MIRCKGKQNIKRLWKSCRQWYSLAVNGLNTALTEKLFSDNRLFSRGFRPSKQAGSHEREITEVGREITLTQYKSKFYQLNLGLRFFFFLGFGGCCSSIS